MYRVKLLPSAAKQLTALDGPVQRHIARRIDQLAAAPRGGNAVKLRGSDDVWRTRVGDYRVLFRIDDDALVILVIKIGHRREVYR